MKLKYVFLLFFAKIVFNKYEQTKRKQRYLYIESLHCSCIILKSFKQPIYLKFLSVFGIYELSEWLHLHLVLRDDVTVARLMFSLQINTQLLQLLLVAFFKRFLHVFVLFPQELTDWLTDWFFNNIARFHTTPPWRFTATVLVFSCMNLHTEQFV